MLIWFNKGENGCHSLNMLPNIPILDTPKLEPLAITIKKEQEKPKEPVKYVIKTGDKLETIAQTHNTTVQRMFDKNTSLSDPDIIMPDQELIIPLPDEALATRPLPTESPVIQPQNGSGGVSQPRPQAIVRRGSVAGNTYSPGSCTWGVKSWKPEVGGNWGNANQWKYNAQRDGWTVSSTPVVGAVAWTGRGSYGHVALVVAVSGNSVTIREMNYDWVPYHERTRTTTASEFTYLY